MKLIQITPLCFADPFNIEAVSIEHDNLNGTLVVMISLKSGQKCPAIKRFTLEAIEKDLQEIVKIINDALAKGPKAGSTFEGKAYKYDGIDISLI